MSVNINDSQFISLAQGFLEYGDSLNTLLTMNPGTIPVAGSYINSISIPMGSEASAYVLAQFNYKDSDWRYIASYEAQAKPNWGSIAEEFDFIYYFQGDNLVVKAGVFNATASPRAVASFTINISVTRFLSPFQATDVI